jgi:hypothetical protein
LLHPLGFYLVEEEFSVLDGVAQDRHSARPFPFAARGGDLVADCPVRNPLRNNTLFCKSPK